MPDDEQNDELDDAATIVLRVEAYGTVTNPPEPPDTEETD